MATSKSKQGGGNIRYDEFIKQVRPDSSNTEQVVLLQGYIGESTKDDQIRLYADAGLAEYMDIAKADILYSVPNSDDPLGGSQLWVKQSSNVNYNDPSGYTQGEMYNDYMGNMYTPGDYNYGGAGGAVTAVCPGPILTRPIICRPSIFIMCTKNIKCFITPRNIMSVCRPCWVTPPRTPVTPVTPKTPANPVEGSGVGFDDSYGGYGDYSSGGYAGGSGDYTGGDLYGDFMSNEYTPESGFGAGTGAITIACPTNPRTPCCPLQTARCISPRTPCCPILTARTPCCPLQTARCISPRTPCCPILTARTPCCPISPRTPCCPLQTARCPVTPGCPFKPGEGGPIGLEGQYGTEYGGFGDYGGGDPSAGYGDYTGGEMYNDYMANEYAPEAGAATTAAITIPICRPTIPIQACPTQPWNCRTVYPLCYTNPALPPCRTRFPACRTNPAYPPCRITRNPITPCRQTIAIQQCWPTRICEVAPGGANFETGYHDPYGYGY